MGQNVWKRYAFISYNHHDVKIAKWLHKKLESYKLPAEIHNEFEDSKYLRPIFRDQEDLNTGILNDELRKHLESSKYLIVICSPYSAKSKWVSNEVKTFIEWGRLEYIIPFIIDGTPCCDEDEECFPTSLLEYIKKYPDRELLGISIPEIGRDKAFVRVVSRMLGVSFDELWKRHERELRRRLSAWCTGSLIFTGLLYYFAIPISVNLQIVDENHRLPMPSDAVVIVDNAEYSLQCLDTTITINTIPSYFRGRLVPISFSSTYYTPNDSAIHLGFGVKDTHILSIKRDSSFALFAGTVVDLDGHPIENATVQIGDSITYTGSKGDFKLRFNVKEQSEYKRIMIQKTGKKTLVRDDECPSAELRYIIYDE